MKRPRKGFYSVLGWHWCLSLRGSAAEKWPPHTQMVFTKKNVFLSMVEEKMELSYLRRQDASNGIPGDLKMSIRPQLEVTWWSVSPNTSHSGCGPERTDKKKLIRNSQLCIFSHPLVIGEKTVAKLVTSQMALTKLPAETNALPTNNIPTGQDLARIRLFRYNFLEW